MAYSALIFLNGKPLSDQGRAPLQNTSDQRRVDHETAKGNLRRYTKAHKNSWVLSWEWLPSEDANTVDGYAARNYLVQMKSSASALTLTVNDITGTQSYTVLVESYSETLKRRDPVINEHFYDIQLELKEV